VTAMLFLLLAQPAAPDCDTFDLTCKASQAGDRIFARVVDTVAQGSAELMVTMSSWWAGADSVDPRDSAVLAAQHATGPVSTAILVGGVLVQSIRMIVSRKAEPLLAVAGSLLRFAVVSALGLTLLQLALQAGDVLARQLLGNAANDFAVFMRDLITHPGDSLFVTLLVAVLSAVLSIVQWLLMAVRQAGLLVLAAMLPLAASGPASG
jgi:type IV secretion system protein TrbL